MRLGQLRPRPEPADDVATALAAAAMLGQRPAVTGLDPRGRHEQGFASLIGWTAKGAHLLRDELGLGPGDVLGVDAPPSWPLATVALAAWWCGVALGPPDPAGYVVAHEGATPGGRDVLWLGDAVDGGPFGRTGPGEAWTAAVTPYPDRPPPPAIAPDGPAVITSAGAAVTQRALLAAWRDDDGPLGLARTAPDGPRPLAAMLGALAARPLVTGSPTVVAHDGWEPGALARAAEAERVGRWI